MNILTQLKQFIRTHFPGFFLFLKQVRNIPGFKQLNALASPVTERFDAHSEDTAYFDKYMNEITRYISSLSSGNEVLDIGCGFGFGTVALASISQVNRVVALDKVEAGEFKFLNHSKIEFHSVDITTFNFVEWAGRFDVVNSTEFIEHISEEQGRNLIQNVYLVLKPGGHFVGSTPLNPTENILYTTNPFHLREYQPDFFKKILESIGFMHVEIKELGDCFVWFAQK